MGDRPFFIVGYPRSGTTLVRFMLASHPEIWVPGETGFIPFLQVPHNRPLGRSEIDRVLRRIVRLRPEWLEPVQRLTSRPAADDSRRLGELLDGLYRHQARERGAARWGDKTPLYVLHMDRIAAIFPDAQFIHVIRDGRDVAVSAVAKWGRRWPQRLYMDHHYVLRRWADAVGSGRAAGRRLGPERYLELHYEDLVRQPEPAIRRICGFLDEEIHPLMLEHERLARAEVPAGGHEEVWRPVSADRVERWRCELPASAWWTAARVAGSLLSDLGYDVEPVAAVRATDRLASSMGALRYGAVRTGQRVLQSLGDAPLNRRRRHRIATRA
jgi:hypothetical protein